MNVAVITGTLKNSLSALKAAQAISLGIKKACNNVSITEIPMSDGGEGFTYCIVKAKSGKIINVKVNDALMRPTDSFFGILPDNTAIIEMAAASGIEKIETNKLNPLIANTYGTGQLIKHALDYGCKNIIIGIGGSATIDGGVGMAMALGVNFWGTNNSKIKLGGQELINIRKIDVSGIDKRLFKTNITVACDVNNTLYGKNGAAYIYGKQKGATLPMIKILDKGLINLSTTVKQQLGIDISQINGGGAAGGLGAGLTAFCNAKIVKGFDFLAQQLDIYKTISNSDIVFTCEGKFDKQSLNGKLPYSLSKITAKYNKPLVILAGAVDDNFDYSDINITAVFPICQKPTLLQHAKLHSYEWLTKTAYNIINTYLINKI